MKEFVFTYPTKVYFGEGVLEKAIAAECGKYGRTVMLAYGGGSMKNGVYDEVMESLEKAGKNVIEFSGIIPNPTYAKVWRRQNLRKRAW